MNVPGVLATVQALVRPGILVPALQLDWHSVHAAGVRYVVFDKDNCLTAPYRDQLVDTLEPSWTECKRVFGSDNVLLAETVSVSLGVPVLCHSAPKPARACARQVVDHFLALAQRSSEPLLAPRVLVVGDRITTDMTFAYRIEQLLRRTVPDVASDVPLCTSVLTTQLWGRESLGTCVLRTVESGVLRRLVRVGIPPGGSWRMRGGAPDLSAWVAALPAAPALRAAPRPPSLYQQLRAAPSVASAIYRLAVLGVRRLRKLPPVTLALERVQTAWCAMVRELFASIASMQKQAWSVLTSAPTQPRHESLLRRAFPTREAPRRGTRSFSTALRCASRAPHEVPGRRRSLPPQEPPSVPRPQSLLRRWGSVLAALIILPLGFFGGIKLSEMRERYRVGDLSHEGEAPAAVEPAPAADAAPASAAQLQRKIASLELEHYHTRREREDVAAKLARVTEREGQPHADTGWGRATMILLGAENRIIQDVLLSKFATPGAVDQTFTDFDGVAYHIESSKEGPLTLSMDIRCWADLAAQGADELLRQIYGTWVQPTAENGYNITLSFDYAAVPPAGADRDALVHAVSLLKRNAMAAPFERAFAEQAQLEQRGNVTASGALIPIQYRADEAMYILPAADRVTVVFSTRFAEETDRIFGKVFLQEFVDARRQPSIQNAPQVLYSNREPPLEIRQVPGLTRTDDTGFVTFVLFPRHFQHPDVRATTISHIQLFRDYLHYHIKCSKAYMHSRMRSRVAEFLKVLNRAKPEHADKERKTASGRTFRRS